MAVIPPGYVGRAARLTEADITATAMLFRFEPALIHAILDVEASGAGFDALNRPKMLFEPYRFYVELQQGGYAAQLDAAVKQGLAYDVWRPNAYPLDSYPRLMQAVQINQDAAHMAASWGLGQVMGSNFAAAGYATVTDMVAAACQSEANQVGAMLSFIVKTGIDGPLRQHQWVSFAQRYNGRSEAEHNYHQKLALAYGRWATKPTPGPVKPPVMANAAPTGADALNAAELTRITTA